MTQDVIVKTAAEAIEPLARGWDKFDFDKLPALAETLAELFRLGPVGEQLDAHVVLTLKALAQLGEAVDFEPLANGARWLLDRPQLLEVLTSTVEALRRRFASSGGDRVFVGDIATQCARAEAMAAIDPQRWLELATLVFRLIEAFRRK